MMMIRLISTLMCEQVLFSLPELAERYVTPAGNIFSSAPSDAAADLPTQLAKVGVALVSGRTGRPPPPAAAAAGAAAADGAMPMDTADDHKPHQQPRCVAQPLDAAHKGGGQAESASQEANSVRPAAFKAWVGKGHPEFSSGRQQVGGELLDTAAVVLVCRRRCGVGSSCSDMLLGTEVHSVATQLAAGGSCGALHGLAPNNNKVMQLNLQCNSKSKHAAQSGRQVVGMSVCLQHTPSTQLSEWRSHDATDTWHPGPVPAAAGPVCCVGCCRVPAAPAGADQSHGACSSTPPGHPRRTGVCSCGWAAATSLNRTAPALVQALQQGQQQQH